MKENLFDTVEFSSEEIEKAKRGFERLARRLDELWSKEELLTAEERKEVELILNNAMVLDEALRGEIPEEFEEKVA